MNILIFCSFLSFCFLQVQSDSFSEFEKILNDADQRFLKYNDDFFGSIVLSLSTLREISSNSMFNGWNATCNFKNVLLTNAKTPEQRECLELERAKWSDKLEEFNSNLYRCLFDYREMGNPIRKKFEKAKEEVLIIHQVLNEVKNNCSIEFGKSEQECIASKIEILTIPFEKLSQDVELFCIEANNLRPKIFIESLNCNAELLENVYKLSNQFQKKFRNCIET